MLDWRAAVCAAAMLLFTTAIHATPPPPRVVASLPPLHGLVAGVTEGIAEPDLLLTAGSSPHAHHMRPSQARQIAAADLIVWIGPGMESFLTAAVDARGADAVVIEAAALPGMYLRGTRDGSQWETHSHDHGHGTVHDHHAHEVDYHLWLDIDNARRIVEATADALAALDPDRSEAYRANAERMEARLTALDAALRERLAPVRDIPYVVFHDAYHYFEARYGLSPAGSVTIHPEQAPGARHLRDLRRRIQNLEAVCVFSEPQFEPAIVASLIRGTEVRRGELDPLGFGIEPGPDAYFEWMERLAENFRACLYTAARR